MNATLLSEPNSQSDLEWLDLGEVKLDPIWSRALPAAGARRFQVAALCAVAGEVMVATSNPQPETVREFLTTNLSQPFRLLRADQAAVRRLLSQIYPAQPSNRNSNQNTGACETVDACDDLMRAAFTRGASDIHLLPGDECLQVRFRVDGILEDYRSYPAHLQPGITSRFKVLAGMNIAEKREPQDGRFSLEHPITKGATDVRVASIPTRYGERVTLRLLTPLEGVPSLPDLGMSDTAHTQFERAISGANGLVLLTGPTGSGKSTTLYTAIRQLLQSHGGNVITVEDPIEYEIPGATQVEVDGTQKVSFAKALRSILRHDPDVIMLGEIRDAETAELAIKASLTGHLVFSTLHTNTAAGAVTRLIDMGVEPFLIAATLRLAVAQRLVRRLCPKCKSPTALDGVAAEALRRPSLVGQTVYQANGCVSCAGKGFVGRTALFEMLPGGDDVSQLISSGATECKLIEHMRRREYKLLVEDGIDKALSGTTTAQQVLSAVTMW